MTEHFPTPWHVDPYSGSVYAADVPKGSPRVADMRGWGYLTGKGHGALGLPETEAIAAQKANAAFIVKAVNNHDALVDALKKMDFLRLVISSAVSHSDNGNYPKVRDAIIAVKEALRGVNALVERSSEPSR